MSEISLRAVFMHHTDYTENGCVPKYLLSPPSHDSWIIIKHKETICNRSKPVICKIFIFSSYYLQFRLYSATLVY